ncbi:MAG: endonuclease/exonuclease/phosphatase family protein [Bacteroidales bacterium]|nr:endonuclease/exonuclease/phosphatase family protein [Bacteroidales bacterium]
MSGKIFHFLIISSTILIFLFLGGAFLSGYINPNHFGWIPFLGLVIIPLLIINFLLIIYWAWVKSKWIFLPIIALILNTGFIISVFNISFDKRPDNNSLKILTYNVNNFQLHGIGNTLSKIETFVNRENPDIICFQEYKEGYQFTNDSIKKIFSHYPYCATYFTSGNNAYASGIAIFSKDSIIGSSLIKFEHETNNSAMWVDILINSDTFRVINVHLQTTSVSQNQAQIHLFKNLGYSAGEKKALFNLAEQMNRNFKIRAEQAIEVHNTIDSTHIPVILCGDFNDTPASYTYHCIKKGLKDGFQEAGNGYTYTYRYFRKLLRIDYILFSPYFKGIEYTSPSLEWSDHNPVISIIERNQ